MALVQSPAQTAEKMAILIEETRPGTLGVRAVELSLSAVMVRFTASVPQGLDQVFCREVAGIVRSICDGAAHATGPVRHPDFCLRLNGLTLDGLATLVSHSDAGLPRFRLNIDRATGNPLAAFRVSARTDTGLALFSPRILSGPDAQLDAERLFDEMLSQLYLPLVNLNAYLRHVLDGSTRGRGESLSHSVIQLKTRAETLQFAFDRLIADRMVDRYAAEPAGRPARVDSTAA